MPQLHQVLHDLSLITIALSYVKSKMSPYGIQVTISEMEYGYQRQGNPKVVLDVEQVVHTRESCA